MRAILLVAWATQIAAAAGLPVRDDYPLYAEDNGVKLGAHVLTADEVKNTFATDLSKHLVIEVGVWPKTELDIAVIDFALRSAGNSPTRPGSPRTIAGVNQRRSQSRRDDILLYPSVGVSTGSYGTGTSVGVGVGTGGGRPAPASTDRDRDTMQLELEERALPEGITKRAVAGYLFFPISGDRTKPYELSYKVDGVDLRLTIPPAKKR